MIGKALVVGTSKELGVQVGGLKVLHVKSVRCRYIESSSRPDFNDVNISVNLEGLFSLLYYHFLVVHYLHCSRNARTIASQRLIKESSVFSTRVFVQFYAKILQFVGRVPASLPFSPSPSL